MEESHEQVFHTSFQEFRNNPVHSGKRDYVTVSRHQDIVFGVHGGKIEEGYVEVYEVQP